MKRILLYVLVMAAALIVPVKSNDVGKLRPVQAVMVSREAGSVIIRTDTDDTGTGTDVLSALENLKATTPAVIYLDTAQFLLLTQDVLEEVQSLRAVMKKDVQVCLANGDVLREETAQFLRVHGQLPQLKTWEKGMDLPILTVMEKRLILEEKNEKNP